MTTSDDPPVGRDPALAPAATTRPAPPIRELAHCHPLFVHGGTAVTVFLARSAFPGQLMQGPHQQEIQNLHGQLPEQRQQSEERIGAPQRRPTGIQLDGWFSAFRVIA